MPEGQPFPGAPSCGSGGTGPRDARGVGLGAVTSNARCERSLRLGGGGSAQAQLVSGTRRRGQFPGTERWPGPHRGPAWDRHLTREGARGCVHTKLLTASESQTAPGIPTQGIFLSLIFLSLTCRPSPLPGFDLLLSGHGCHQRLQMQAACAFEVRHMAERGPFPCDLTMSPLLQQDAGGPCRGVG